MVLGFLVVDSWVNIELLSCPLISKSRQPAFRMTVDMSGLISSILVFCTFPRSFVPGFVSHTSVHLCHLAGRNQHFLHFHLCFQPAEFSEQLSMIFFSFPLTWFLRRHKLWSLRAPCRESQPATMPPVSPHTHKQGVSDLLSFPRWSSEQLIFHPRAERDSSQRSHEVLFSK